MKTKRSTSKIRNSEPIDDILRHVGTKQYLFLETHICTIYRVTCAPGETFSESKALSLIEKYHRKRQAHCNAGLLEDRFSLERTKTTGKIPFRPWVSYKEIMHFYYNLLVILRLVKLLLLKFCVYFLIFLSFQNLFVMNISL
ncbi:hypothetical protein MS3_00004290 [Schistosoma haematobium]|uniref:Trematode PH-like domain-containing protein n=1 Tax=Schistosoma haematobium TaxID=6185 RepID=A0A922S3V8_SCHHA|nr:hypothetical protein MS3_00004290 [Schistosoma haematobium]KAH9592327.1 hypothetical protein MS3_00004290 [Schistosoma haematobium]